MIICPQPIPGGGVAGNPIGELCPAPNNVATYFTEIILDGNLIIPPQKPPKAHLLKVTHQAVINDVEVITVNLPPVPPATTGTTGYKILVSGVVTLAIQYVAVGPEQKVHSVHYDLPFNAIVMGDCGELLTTLPTDFVAHVCVEKIRVVQVDPRTLNKQIVLLVWIESL